jgi:threonylcarbamoyladenosine tRNA methylthiotransferase MtaB
MGFMHGFTGNYIKVSTLYNPELVNQIKKVKLERLDEDMTYLVNEKDLT